MKTNDWTMLYVSFVAMLTVLTGVGLAEGYATGFETKDNPEYTAGSTIIGVDNWECSSAGSKTNRYTIVNKTDGLVNDGEQALRIGVPRTTQGGEVSRSFTAVSGDHVIVSVYIAASEQIKEGRMAIFGSGKTAAIFGFYTSGGNNRIAYLTDKNTRKYISGYYVPDTYYHFVADFDMTKKTYSLKISGEKIDVTINDIAFYGNNDVTEINRVNFYKAYNAEAKETFLYIDDLSITDGASAASAEAKKSSIVHRRRDYFSGIWRREGSDDVTVRDV